MDNFNRAIEQKGKKIKMLDIKYAILEMSDYSIREQTANKTQGKKDQ